MGKITIKVDKEGQPSTHFAAVKIGNERMTYEPTRRGFVVCQEHGDTRVAWVRHRGALVKCCRACVQQHCHMTVATPSALAYEQALDDSKGGDSDGHL